MAFIENPPLLSETLDKLGPVERFARPWQRWLQKITSRFQQLMPSQDASEDIVWDDMRVNAGNFTLGAAADPGFGSILASGNLRTWLFAGTGPTEELYFEVQLAHKYKPGSDIYPHVHWMKTTAAAGDVIWQLEYSWTNVGAAFAAPTTIATTTTYSHTPAQWTQVISSFGAVTGTGKKESSVMFGRLFRDPAHASDTYAADAALVSFDIHFQNEKIGTGERIPT